MDFSFLIVLWPLPSAARIIPCLAQAGTLRCRDKESMDVQLLPSQMISLIYLQIQLMGMAKAFFFPFSFFFWIDFFL